MINDGPIYDTKLAQVQHIVKLLANFKEHCHIVMSGNGDPLASAIMRPLIHDFKPGPNQSIRLFTNGLLLEKQLTDSPLLKHISQYFISIDAGSKSVYEQVRLGGKWSQLIANLDWLKTVKEKFKCEVLLKFVLQKDNYQDMQNFATLCIDYGFDGVINRLEDWGTWTDFSEHDVISNINHKDHLAAMYFLQSTYSQYHNKIKFNSSLISAIS
jgi:MoaA/NifB/PqqE/SkfB family radical SAM enzyme